MAYSRSGCGPLDLELPKHVIQITLLRNCAQRPVQHGVQWKGRWESELVDGARESDALLNLLNHAWHAQGPLPPATYHHCNATEQEASTSPMPFVADRSEHGILTCKPQYHPSRPAALPLTPNPPADGEQLNGTSQHPQAVLCIPALAGEGPVPVRHVDVANCEHWHADAAMLTLPNMWTLSKLSR